MIETLNALRAQIEALEAHRPDDPLSPFIGEVVVSRADVLAVIANAASQSAASPLPSGAWEPISSAPKDKPVLTWRGAGLMAVAERMDHPADFGKKRQREIWCCTDGCELLNVTHWMPLPAAPPQEPQ